MPRIGNTYTLPAGNPLTQGNVITSSQLVSNFNDLASEMSNSATIDYVTTAVSGASGGGGTPGQVAHFAMSTPPTGWLKANGAVVSRTTYATLFAAIGTTFGVGDGSTTFKLPDMRGEFIRGWDDSRGVDAGRGFGTAQADAFKSHTHTVSVPYY